MFHIHPCAERLIVTKVKWFAMKLGSTPSRQKVTFVSDSRLRMLNVSVVRRGVHSLTSRSAMTRRRIFPVHLIRINFSGRFQRQAFACG
jgi:hypothetical protein